jgi:hypothetical protein
MDGKLHVKTKEQAERLAKSLKRKQTRDKIDAEMGIPGAHKQFEKMQKEIQGLKLLVAGQEVRIQKLMVWKIQQEMK